MKIMKMMKNIRKEKIYFVIYFSISYLLIINILSEFHTCHFSSHILVHSWYFNVHHWLCFQIWVSWIWCDRIPWAATADPWWTAIWSPYHPLSPPSTPQTSSIWSMSHFGPDGGTMGFRRGAEGFLREGCRNITSTSLLLNSLILINFIYNYNNTKCHI